MAREQTGAPLAVRMAACHLADVAELERLCFADPWSEESLRLLLGETALGFVVTEDGRAVAYGGMLCVAGEGQITNIAVHPDCRRKGIARSLITAAIQSAEGLDTVFLEVRESNTPAVSLYESLGFERIGVRKGYYQKPKEDAVLMKMTLM